MEEHGVHRLVVIPSQAANTPDRQTWPQRLVLRHALSLFFGATYDDMRRMAQVLRESSVDWTQVRAPYISSKSAKGSYRFSIDRQPSRYRSITASDMATALLDTADRPDLARKDVFAGN